MLIVVDEGLVDEEINLDIDQWKNGLSCKSMSANYERMDLDYVLLYDLRPTCTTMMYAVHGFRSLSRVHLFSKTHYTLHITHLNDACLTLMSTLRKHKVVIETLTQRGRTQKTKASPRVCVHVIAQFLECTFESVQLVFHTLVCSV